MLTIYMCSIAMICSVSALSAQNGVTYTYDAAGNRITRRPNTITLGADVIQNASGTNGVRDTIFEDYLLGDALRVRYSEGSRSFNVLLGNSLLSNDGCIEISPSIPGALPLLRIEQLAALQYLDMNKFPIGDYIMRITTGGVQSIWSITII